MKTNFLEELKWRGMLHDCMPETENYLNQHITPGYVGFDPTASSLTIGNLVTIMLLVHYQAAGHKPIALVGGATGMIGDPSGKSSERNLLSEEALLYNQQCIKAQLEKFLDFGKGAQSAELVNNFDWFKEIGFISFLRDVGKHLTVSYMMAKDSVKNRLEGGISFTEFSYQLLQAYDFLYLYKTKGVRLQMGGSDQWGNITSGTELIRRMEDGQAYALTTPLLTKSDGTKFGKSAGGAVWLDPKQTSPYKFYQFWLNSADDDVARFIRIFTLLNKEEIEDLESQHAKAPQDRILQKTLAKDITCRVHSLQEYENALKASEILFGKSVTDDMKSIDEDTLLSVFEGLPLVDVPKSLYFNQPNIVDFLSTDTAMKIFPSKTETRKMIQQGGISINKVKVESTDDILQADLLHDRYLIVQKGKKNYFLIRFQ
ncbi:MAG: tyrosine--tRNA ligase [Cytophagaceae bacterium]|jgi:tyrosyl-tRNA synthetase|nr:tyrosine--tRNA ligase [Cytophagaceae bacterium]